jgi:hypothetical protein
MVIAKYPCLIGLFVLLFLDFGYTLEVPDFAINVPEGHFIGISSPCDNLQSSRQSAITDVTKQVLGSIQADYTHKYSKTISGNPADPELSIRDDFSSNSFAGTSLGIEKNIVRTHFAKDNIGHYVCFVLVEYSQQKITEIRRLSRKANIVVSAKNNPRGSITIKVSESNNVAVVLSSVSIDLEKKYSFAGFYNFCIWKVPYGSKSSFSVPFDPVKVVNGTSKIRIETNNLGKNWKDILLGADTKHRLRINGYDEIGREVSAWTEF